MCKRSAVKVLNINSSITPVLARRVSDSRRLVESLEAALRRVISTSATSERPVSVSKGIH